MGVWKSIKDKAVLDCLIDEELYAQAVREIHEGRRREGLWAKAIVQSGPDEAQAKVAYVRLLVQRLKDEWYLAEQSGHQANPQSSRPVSAPPGYQADQQHSRTASAPRAPKSFDFSKFQSIDENAFNRILQQTGELRFQYLLRRWYTSQGGTCVLDRNTPGAIVSELQKYFGRHKDYFAQKSNHSMPRTP